MGTNPRTPRYTAGEKQGRCAAPAFSLFLRPPHPRSGDQLFSTINTHGSTSGSLNYTYCGRPGSGLLTSNYAKGGDSLGPDHKSVRPREGGWSAGPAFRRRGPSSAPRPDPGPRLDAAVPGRGLRAGPPGRAAAPPRPSACAAAGLTRGGGAEPAGRPRPDPSRAAPPPRPKRSRAAEAARAGRGVAQEAGGRPGLRGREARSPAGGGREAAGCGAEGEGRASPAAAAPPLTSSADKRYLRQRGKMVAAPRGGGGRRAERGYARDAGVAAEASSSSRPAGRRGPRRPGFRAALLSLRAAAAAAQRPSRARLVGTVQRRETPRPSACGGGPAAGARPRHVTTLFTVPGQRRACALQASGLRGRGPPAGPPELRALSPPRLGDRLLSVILTGTSLPLRCSL